MTRFFTRTPYSSRPRTSTQLFVAACLASTAASCVVEAEDDVFSQKWATATVEQEEAQLEADALAEALARKERYLATGAPPTVPRALSSNPYDPSFQFVGYADEATDADVQAMEARMDRELRLPMSAEEQASLDKDFYQQDSLGLFVNMVGETWRWRLSSTTVQLPDPLATEDLPVNPSSYEDTEEATLANKILIIGSDDRQVRSAWAGHDMTAYPWNVMGALDPDGQPSNTPKSTCTATKIGPRHLLTAGHCVWSGGAGGKKRLRDWWRGQDGLDQYMTGGDPSPNPIKNMEWYWVAPGWYDHGWSSQDYAVLMLYDNQSSADIGTLGLRVDSTLAGTEAWNFGYPGSSYTCASSPRPDKLCSNSMWGMKANITRTEIPYLFFKHDVQKGHSGSPLYQIDNNKRYVVGVVTTSYTDWENRGVKIRKVVFDNIQAVKNAWPSSYD